MNESNLDAPALVRRRRRIARQQREKTPEPIAKTMGGIKPKFSDDESSSTTTTTNEYEKRRTNPAMILGTTRVKVKTASNSSAGSGNSSNVAYREKILNRRDRASRSATIVRSQSTPREIPPDSPTPESKSPSDTSGNVVRFLRKAKRSLSIPRRRRDVACETSPIRGHDEVIKRYVKSPIVKTESKMDAVNGRDENSRLTKLEMNLKRFEDERKVFALEREKFEREKRHMEQMRFQRLLEFERKRSMQQSDREQLAIEAAAIALAEIEKQKIAMRHRRSKSRGSSFTGSTTEAYGDDYESSTATSSSSRDDDFKDHEFANEIPFVNFDEPVDIDPVPTFETNNVHVPTIEEPITTDEIPKQSLFLSRFLFGKAQPKKMTPIPSRKTYLRTRVDDGGPISVRRIVFVESPLVWQQVIELHQHEWNQMMRIRNRCIANFLLLCIFFGFGGLMFRFVEGAFENFYKCGVRRVKRDFVDHLWTSSHDLSEDDWKSLARTKLRGFEDELHTAHEAGFKSYSGLKSWTFINGVVYCMTVVTTIGYGHISPSTNTGRAITIIYAIIGIPMFLILLADFGKLFTRGIKFVWAYVRRLYYTGSLRRVRKQAQVQEMIRGMSIAYDIATFRRPSMLMKESDMERAQTASPNQLGGTVHSETPTTPMPPEMAIDDEFNLPISLALFILIAYILCGAAVYSLWEDWSFFESCYFVFVSMSTIGFGDYVPQHPARMMASIIYLIFGLSLTSMCINVVQVKLSDSFRHASAKIGATIGLSLAEEEARSSQNLTPAPENSSVHSYGKNSPSDDPKLAVDGDTYDNAEVRDGKIITDIKQQPLSPNSSDKKDINNKVKHI
ncbi:uncharacterized protein LOC129574881 [Sitodiplosis mosellana]|uniref:uncharacterized protein LOC129574881 n=1 Tax=Sitodiplosis mosellana TaxID=263140 RepID=UPI002444C502|nr:uncharacterized protein LOC129574881 [Sitodiplosis mosellana]